MMALPRFFFGIWKISDSVSKRRKFDTKGINETEFQLTTTGYIIWKTTNNTGNFPLLNCKVYAVHKSSYAPYWKLMFGSGKGHVVDCEIDSIKNSGEFVFSDGWCIYTCRRINKYGEYPMEAPFDLLPALEYSYFSDLVIKASNNKEFQVHKCIVQQAAPKLDWLADPPPLSGFSESVLNTILHFLYSGCLPKGLSKESLQDVISVASDLPGMEKLVSLCLFQKENLTLKKKIIDLVSDVGVSISKMLEIFTQPEKKYHMFSYEFDELYSAVKMSFQEGAVGIAKFLLLCKTYSDAGTKLSQEDNLEILDHILSKVPTYNNNLKRYTQNLMGIIRKIHSVPDYWESLTIFLIPKVQDILDTISSILLKIGECSGAVASAFQEHYDDYYVNKCSDSLKYPVDSEFDKSPMSTVFFFVKEFKGILFQFEKEKRRFNRIDLDSKARLISLALEEFLGEINTFRDAFIDFLAFLQKQVIKGKVYFGMRAVAMKTADVVNRFLARRACLVDLILQFCDLVERDLFFECVASLGFLDPPNSTNDTEDDAKNQEKDRFPVVESACKSPPAFLSHLSQMGRQLLESREFDDMVFEVIFSNEVEHSLTFTQSDSDDSDSESNSDSDSEPTVKSKPERFQVKSHRAIVSSRCDWFRLALASGMKEAINRKIEIPITPSLFSLFLEFLYTGSLTELQVAFDDFLKLLLLSDRYDFEHLKEVCEYHLKGFIDEHNIFMLFTVADRCNASKLKLHCEHFIAENPTVVSSDRFRDLPDNLKREAIICSKNHATNNSILVKILCNDSFEKFEESLVMLKKRLNSMGIQASDYDRMVSALRPKLEQAVVQLREKFGAEVPRSILIRTILDADYDVNRAAVLYILRSKPF